MLALGEHYFTNRHHAFLLDRFADHREWQRCLSSDRQHAGTCAAGGPTEMCTLSSVDLGSEGITCRST
jgi:hypothetical protein